jgi:hypothetical protein
MRKTSEWVELAEREAEGRTVTLYWRPRDGSTCVGLVDSGRGRSSFAEVPSECALDAFRRPLSYIREARDTVVAETTTDVDQLWLSELAAELIAELSEMLARGCADGGSQRDGV